ncbi:MAG: hypothetical protein ACOH5I_17255 [Oligoflexus sp.]
MRRQNKLSGAYRPNFAALFRKIFFFLAWLYPFTHNISVADENRQHYMSGIAGSGVAWTQKGSKTVGSLTTQGSFRLLFDLQMTKRYLWGVDLDWMRIRSRDDSNIPHRLDVEGLGFVTGFRHEKLSLWGKLGGGRMYARRGELERSDAARFAYYQTTIGANLAIYQTRYVWWELVTSLAWLRTGERWNKSLSPEQLGLASFLISIKIFDL